MDVYYTENELKEKKYADLLKIAKVFGVKGGRQKANKLISSILKFQNGQQQLEGISENHFDESIASSTGMPSSPAAAPAAIDVSANEESSDDSILDVNKMLEPSNMAKNSPLNKLEFNTSLLSESTENGVGNDASESADGLLSPRQSRSKANAREAVEPLSRPSKRRRTTSLERIDQSPKRKLRKTRASIAYGGSLATARKRPRRRGSVAPSSDQVAKVASLEEPQPGINEEEEVLAPNSSGTSTSATPFHPSISHSETKSSQSSQGATPAKNRISSPKQAFSTSKKAKQISKTTKRISKKRLNSKSSPEKSFTAAPAKPVLNTSKTLTPEVPLKITSSTQSVTPSANESVRKSSTPRKSASISKENLLKAATASPRVKKLSSKSVPASQKKKSLNNPTPKLVQETRPATRKSSSNGNISIVDGSESKSLARLKRNASFTIDSSQSQATEKVSASSAPQGPNSSPVGAKSASLSKVATPLRLPGISSAQSKRLSEARRLSSPRVQRVEPTYAKPAFTIGRKDDGQAETAVKTTGAAKSSIPRFMAYAQKIKKMPNFKRIHEKAFGTMQDIDDFVAKKKKLAESVTKQVKNASSGFVPSVTSPTKLKLNFSATPSGPNSPVVRFGASVGSASKAPAATDSKKVASARRVSSIKENVRPVTPRASIATTWGAGPGLRRASTAAIPTPRSALKTKNQATVTKSVSQKTRIADASQGTENVDMSASVAATYKLDPARSVGRTSVMAGSVKGSAKICKPVFSSNKRGSSNVFAPTSSARKSTATAEDKKPGQGGSRLPLYKFGAPSHGARRVAGKAPPVASQAERRAETQDFIKGVRTNKRFRLQMERRGINI